MITSRLTDRLEVYSETTKKRTFVGTLRFDATKKKFIFEYDRKYLRSKTGIPIGPDLPLKKAFHESKGSNLFASFEDRIPSRDNPAYADYCRDQGISESETNPIALLTTIGRRGPSTFVFEAVLVEESPADAFRHFRTELGLNVRETATAFGLNYSSLNRIETGKSKDKNLLRLLAIFLEHPEVALEQIARNRVKIHPRTYKKLEDRFREIALRRKETGSLFK